MSYSDLFLKKNRVQIPTFVLLIAIILTSIFMTRIFTSKPLTSRASKKTVKRIEVVNLSYNQATIYWQTDAKETGWLIYGETEKKLDQIALDERDVGEKRGAYFNHYVILKNLKQNQSYYYKIVSNDKLVAGPDDKPYQFKTTANIASVSNVSPAYGKVLAANGLPVTAGVVILSFKDAFPLFSSIKLSGEWMIPLNNLVDKTTKKIKSLKESDVGLLEIYSEKGEKSLIEITVENLSPVPQSIIIGKDYSFLSKENVLGLTKSYINTNNEISIIFPKENSLVPSKKPLIKGLGIPGNDVFVYLKSNLNYSFRVKTDKDGIWQVVLNKDLPAEKYILEIVTKNVKGDEVRLARTFSVAKSGEQVMGSATPEATLEPTAPPPTSVPTKIITSLTPMPTSGYNPRTLTIVSGSLIIIGLGILLAF
jgi:hypothetical protein